MLLELEGKRDSSLTLIGRFIFRFTNHSKNANCVDKSQCDALKISLASDAPDGSYAIKDIEEGDEITENYGEYESIDYYEKLCEEHGVESTSVCANKY